MTDRWQVNGQWPPEQTFNPHPFKRRLHMKHADFWEVIQRPREMADRWQINGLWPSQQTFNPSLIEGSIWSIKISETSFKDVVRWQTDDKSRDCDLQSKLSTSLNRRLHMKHGDFKEVIQRHRNRQIDGKSTDWPSEQTFPFDKRPHMKHGDFRSFKGVDKWQKDAKSMDCDHLSKLSTPFW